LRAEAASGTRAAVLAPIGFVCDHVEVLYDLDIEAAAVARELGMSLARASTCSVHPAYIAALAEGVLLAAG
jgi:ferrochelatase